MANMVTGYSSRPLRMVSVLGVLLTFVAVAAFIAGVYWIFSLGA